MSAVIPGAVTAMIPAKARAVIYTVFGLVGVGVGATEVGYLAARADQPVWLVVAIAVYSFLGTAFGYTALTHTPSSDAAGSIVTTPTAVVPNSAVVADVAPVDDASDAPVEVDAPTPTFDDDPGDSTSDDLGPVAEPVADEPRPDAS